jgi:hypothetical protein
MENKVLELIENKREVAKGNVPIIPITSPRR